MPGSAEIGSRDLHCITPGTCAGCRHFSTRPELGPPLITICGRKGQITLNRGLFPSDKHRSDHREESHG